MKPANVFQLELASAVTARRALVMRLGLTGLLALPFVFAAMPAGAKVGGVLMLLVFVSFFGSAVAVARRRTDGRLTRLAVLPIARWRVALDLVLSAAAVDLLQTALPLGLLLAVNARAVSAWGLLAAAGAWAVAAVLLNGLGMLLARAARSNPEVHLLAALATAGIALLSGVFPVPARIAPAVTATAAVSPLGWLGGQLSAMLGGAAAADATAGLAGAAAVLATIALMLWRGLER